MPFGKCRTVYIRISHLIYRSNNTIGAVMDKIIKRKIAACIRYKTRKSMHLINLFAIKPFSI